MTHRIGANLIDLEVYLCERRARTRAAFEDEIDALLALVSRTRTYYALARPRDNVVKLETRRENNG